MEVSTILLVILFLALVCLTIAYTVLVQVRPQVLESLTPKTGPMNVGTRVGTSADGRDKFLASSGGTVMCHIFTAVNNKTPQIGNSQDPIRILSIGNAVSLQLLPGGVSQPPKTVLSVRTQNPDPTKPNIEQFDVLAFPQQKWVHTAIVREGRRYTIFYNGKVVSSHRTQYYPVVESSTLTLGDSRLMGEFIYPKIAPTAYRMEEIQAEITANADTRYEPIRPMDWSQLFNLNLGCPNGLFCFSTTGTPQGEPLKTWQSPYA